MSDSRIGGDANGKVWLGHKNSLDELYSSETFKRLNDPACGLYYESPVYVFSYLQNEIESGIVK